MTALCGGGASEPLPLVQPVVQLTAAIAEAIAAGFGVPEMGYPLSLAVAGMSIATVEVCGTDPPPDPGLTQVDILDALNVLEPFVALPAQAKIKDWFLHRYWWQICQCSSVATPPPPVPSNPNTPVGIGTGAPSGGAPQPCWTGSGPVLYSSTVQNGSEWTAPWLSDSGPGIPTTIRGRPFTLSVPPPGTTSVSWDLQPLPGNVRSTWWLGVGQAGGGFGMFVGQLDSAGDPATWRATHPITPGPNDGYLVEISPFVVGSDVWTAGWTGTLSFNCESSPPNSIVQPCCPPDPLLSIKLDQLLGLVLDLYGRPGASGIGNYTKGTVHAGLSGSGSIPVHGRVGVLVDITAQASAPVLPGNPPYLFDQGWLSVLTPDGFIDEKRLTRTQQIWLPALFPISTQFGYFFNPGVTATVTELLPA